MPIWTWTDVAFYAAIVTVNSTVTLPLVALFALFFRGSVFLFVKLPWHLFVTFKLTTFSRRDPFGQQATVFEYATVQCVRYVLSHFNAETMGTLLFGETIVRLLYEFRRFRYGTELIGDNVYEPLRSVSCKIEGYWMRSKSRKAEKYDVVIYFVPGNLMGFASSYVFLEFLATLLVNLQSLGFKNPATFVLDFNYYSEDYKSAVGKVQDGWAYITEATPNSVHVIMSSSIGSSVVLTSLLNMVEPFIDPDSCVPELPIYNGEIVQPSALIMISPMGRLLDYDQSFSDDAGDFITDKCLNQLIRKFVFPEDIGKVWLSPMTIGDSDTTSQGLWAAAMPKRGIYISAGDTETLIPEILALKKALDGKVRLYLESEEGQLHGWPLVLEFIGRTGTTQQMGIDRVAVNISNMVLMDCLSSEGTNPPKVLGVEDTPSDQSEWLADIGQTFNDKPNNTPETTETLPYNIGASHVPSPIAILDQPSVDISPLSIQSGDGSHVHFGKLPLIDHAAGIILTDLSHQDPEPEPKSEPKLEPEHQNTGSNDFSETAENFVDEGSSSDSTDIEPSALSSGVSTHQHLIS